MAPIFALAFKLLPFLTAVPEAVDALKGGNAAGAAKVILDAATGASGEKDPAKAVDAIAKSPELQLKFQELMSGERVRLAELALEETKAFVADTADARRTHAGDRGVFWLGVVILSTFAVVMGAALYGCYQMLTDGLKIKDVGVVAAIFGFLGTVIGYVAANAQQVVSYFFGSSRGSQDKTNAMSEAFKRLGG